MSSDATFFHDLPTELILDICDFLPLDALLALKLTAPRLNTMIRLDPRRWQDVLSPCARRAIHSYLNPSPRKPDQQHCRLCNSAYPVAMFSSSTSPACIPMKLTTTPHDVVQLPSNICSWHATAAETNGPVARTTCVCIVETSWAGQDEAVTCDSCGFWAVRTYTRHLNNSKECQRFLFWREASGLAGSDAGQLWVWEACVDDDVEVP
ncbi:hypothetical protein COCMIDRAFT_28905 [Bipolaris oryzae ATCC 44560]|uniref:F-box domain-containing protein n=1 Tax=Bipolaris oryzae ATCC 44560 TaxID=930090 RepID=W6YY10_COCMI|nr:uncharacterized protein COCMIDRAFT_28905 [Bipolaris oryzae ATCC 44560]EUC42470.1 hypothetical protein COCMIDRAFT_28905 [Bipolaris oryzae ATCC 44560]